MNIAVMVLLLAGMVVSAMVCVIMSDLLKAAIALAVVSALLSIVLFLLEAPLAAVFELSVCAGVITVIFVSAISMTRLRTQEEAVQVRMARRKRFALLPVLLLALLTLALIVFWPQLSAPLLPPAPPASGETVQDVLWNKRQADLLGQIAIILAGVYGVLIFFKERDVK